MKIWKKFYPKLKKVILLRENKSSIRLRGIADPDGKVDGSVILQIFCTQERVKLLNFCLFDRQRNLKQLN